MDIKSLRVGMGLSQAEFAEKLGISHGYAGHIETGWRKPSLKLAVKIERLTGAQGLVAEVAAEKAGIAA